MSQVFAEEIGELPPHMRFDTSEISWENPNPIPIDNLIGDILDDPVALRSYCEMAKIAGLGFTSCRVGPEDYIHAYSRDLDTTEDPHDHTSKLEIVTCVPKGRRMVVRNFEPLSPDEIVPKLVDAEPYVRVANTRILLPGIDQIEFMITPLNTIPLVVVEPIIIKTQISGQRVPLGEIHTVSVENTTGIRPQGTVFSIVKKTGHPPVSETDSLKGLMNGHQGVTEAEAEKILKARAEVQAAIDSGDYPEGTSIGWTTMVYKKLGNNNQIKRTLNKISPIGEKPLDIFENNLYRSQITVQDIILGNA